MIPTFYAMVLAATLWLALLWLAGRIRPGARPRALGLVLGIPAMLLLFLPIGEARLWSWAFGFCPNPSMLLLGVVCAGLWQRLFGLEVLKPADWTALWWFAALAGTTLYLQPLVAGRLDLYYWGWEHGVAAWALAGLAVAFLAAGNRLGVLLLAALIGYSFDALESVNGWDYVVDPFVWLLSLGVLGARIVKSLLARRRRRRAASAPPFAVTGNAATLN
jgi:hypothetical protein